MENKKFATIREACKMLGIPEHALRRMVRAGKCEGFFAGSRFYVNLPATEEALHELSKENGSV